jgi:hypothetical protein
MTLLAAHPTARSVGTNRVLRRQIDRCVSRALVDAGYARRLLTDPTIAVEQSGCSPQQFKTLRGIQAVDVVDFARQAHALFWRADGSTLVLEENLPLVS